MVERMCWAGHSGKRWRGRVTVNHHFITVGYFPDEQAARRGVEEYRRKHFSEWECFVREKRSAQELAKKMGTPKSPRKRRDKTRSTMSRVTRSGPTTSRLDSPGLLAASEFCAAIEQASSFL